MLSHYTPATYLVLEEPGEAVQDQLMAQDGDARGIIVGSLALGPRSFAPHI
jgi:hypothetical protein